MKRDAAARRKDAAASAGGAGRLYVVATPIGNLEDITLRALRILGKVPIIAAEDTRAAAHLIAHHLIGAAHPPRVLSFFVGNEAARTQEILALLQEGQDVALISEAGLPGISDPGQRLVAAARAQSLPVEVIPGACAAVTALVGSGLPTDRFMFVGFLPRRASEKEELLLGLRREPGTLIFYEAPDRAAGTLRDLAAVFGPERRACLARELTKLYEEYVSGSLGELMQRYADAPPRGEVTLLVSGWTGENAADAAAGEVSKLEQIETSIRERLQAGQGAREIAAALSLQFGLPRRRIYQLAITLAPREASLAEQD